MFGLKSEKENEKNSRVGHELFLCKYVRQAHRQQVDHACPVGLAKIFGKERVVDAFVCVVADVIRSFLVDEHGDGWVCTGK
jgi:hypothetical protein